MGAIDFAKALYFLLFFARERYYNQVITSVLVVMWQLLVNMYVVIILVVRFINQRLPSLQLLLCGLVSVT